MCGRGRLEFRGGSLVFLIILLLLLLLASFHIGYASSRALGGAAASSFLYLPLSFYFILCIPL
jgi:hypothetical protein